MVLSDGEKVAVVTGVFLIGTKLFDALQSRFGTKVATTLSREQALYDRIQSLEERLDHKDEDCEKRIEILDKRVDANRIVIDELRKENERLEGEVHQMRWDLSKISPSPPSEKIE